MFNLLLRILLVSILVTNPVLAGEATYLEKDAKAPFSGYLITEDTANKIRIMDIDLKSITRQNVLLKDEITILTERLNNTQEFNKELVKANKPVDSFIPFAGGIVVGFLMVWVAGQAIK